MRAAASSAPDCITRRTYIALDLTAKDVGEK
jgi:hypothetical protein